MAACALVLAGCGGGAEELDRSAEPTGFEMALDGVGRGISPSGIGFGWVDIAAIRDAAGPAAVREAAAALGPGADELLERGAALRRSAGFDPLTADAAIGLGASYAFGVRFDGVNAARLGDRLDAAGARSYRIGAWTVYDLGEQAQAPTSGPLADLDTFAARVAIRNGAVIMARVDSTRYALLGVGGSTVADEVLAFGAACLGEVDAARTLPGGFTHNAFASPDLIALGRRVGAPAGGEEVLCAVDRSADDAEEQASALRESFAPDATEPLTGEPMSDLVASAEVEELADGDLHAARATIELAPGARQGLLFGALVRGSVLPYLGGPEPVP